MAAAIRSRRPVPQDLVLAVFETEGPKPPPRRVPRMPGGASGGRSQPDLSRETKVSAATTPADTSFPKKVRLGNAAQFSAVFSGARYKASRRSLLLLAIENHSDLPRLGLVVPRKHIRTAVQRNKVKRILRESFRHHKELLAGLDVVILIRGGLDSQDNKTIANDAAKLWADLARKSATRRTGDGKNPGRTTQG